MSTTREKTYRIAVSGVTAALILVMTIISIPVPITQGYVNLGDGAILLTAFVLGPMAWIPAAVGSAMCDLMMGYSVYILPTFIIKGTMGLIAGLIAYNAKKKKNSLKAPFISRLTAGIFTEIIMVSGYFLFEALPFVYGFEAALGAIVPNLVQGAAGLFIGVTVSSLPFFEKIKSR